MGYSMDAVTSDCYEGTTCLINKLDIRDEKQLSMVEADITFAKASYLEQNPIEGNFDFEHYKAIHKYLFEDLYNWAGQIRTVNISKKGTNFAEADSVEDLAINCFERLKSNNYFKDLRLDNFVNNIVDFYYITNMLHPFREGNGRTQRVFISQLIRNAGYDIDFSEINSDDLMIATIQAANGVFNAISKLFSEHIVEPTGLTQSM